MRSILCRVGLVLVCCCVLCGSAFAYDDEPPADPPFYGSAFVSGSSRELGDITLYFPISYQTGYLGVDSNGYLYNVSNSSITCYLEGYDYCNIPAWSYPRYRTGSSSYTYEDLHIIPEHSNAQIAEDMTGLFSFDDLAPYFTILMLGVLFVCFMKRS